MKIISSKKIDNKEVYEIIFAPFTLFAMELNEYNKEVVKVVKKAFEYNPAEKKYNALYTYATISALFLMLEVGKYYGVIDFDQLFDQLHRVINSHNLFVHNITKEIDTFIKNK